MRIINFIFIVTVFLFWSCNTDSSNQEISTDIINNPQTAQENTEQETNTLPEITFDKKNFDFGLIMQGEKVTHKYSFTNTGNSDLVISNVSANCGCTIPTYTRNTIQAGESGYIDIAFDSDGRSGIQEKTITVLSNAQPNRITLTFTADIDIPNN